MRGRFRAIGISAALAAALACLPASAGADTYTVTRTDDPPPDACLPTDCSLREALEASNASTAVDDLVLVPASFVPYAVELESKPLEIEDQVEVRGERADQVVLEGTGKGVVVHNQSPGVVLGGLTITGGAGGIQNDGQLTLYRVSVEHNDRSDEGGGIQSAGPLTIDSSFVGFNSSSDGGGIAASTETTVVNSTIAWNTSSGVAGILVGGSGGFAQLILESSAVVFNDSSGADDAGTAADLLLVQDNVFAGNTNSNGMLNCRAYFKMKSLGGNVEDGTSCSAAIPTRPNPDRDWPRVDPRLGTLALHGGMTPVYDLLYDSPAIDAAYRCPSVDQRGVLRPQGPSCDSGPYEVTPVHPRGPSAPADHEFFMKVGRKLRLAKNAIWAKLTCPSSEVSPPCQGQSLVLDPPLVFHGPHTLQGRPLKGQFSIWPGRTQWVPLREPRGRGKRLPKERGKWKVSLLVLAEDGAGNEWRYRKLRRVPLIRR